VFQFLLALLGTTATQKGVLWWAAHHRDHHRFSDQPEDIHSPVLRGFWWSHLGWILSNRYSATKLERIRDFARYPELRWLDRHHVVPAVVYAVALWAVGGMPALLWGYFVSTVMLWHGTFLVNSLAHVVGRRRYATTDSSRNSLLIALATMGEGWHNNHHHYQSTANQGWFWWEIDVSYYLLRALERLGVVHGLRKPPPAVRDATSRSPGAAAPVRSAEPAANAWPPLLAGGAAGAGPESGSLAPNPACSARLLGARGVARARRPFREGARTLEPVPAAGLRDRRAGARRGPEPDPHGRGLRRARLAGAGAGFRRHGRARGGSDREPRRAA
jgi:stearoyl-CoA desaturase (delta-9 desaturase)